ncbi:hypothetical protein KO527_18575 [Pseudoalteromonas sp. C2R02]|uniref:TRAFAC clade GTPase domain-containing protein n=1 Tax=Pseudoalteromonas sp. C2R02 TaxID=2841565 RepID=UPI001C085EE1|nr:hypothetical protein [Pseudoalteromonas sp. C2R02]MBU2971350.1 hypothetical protein [Pseudoalteromonas sp. C2R02]
MNRRILELAFVLGTVIIFIVTVLFTVDYDIFKSTFSSILVVLVSGLMGIYVSFIYSFLKKNPTPFRAFIIGQPRAGKTVYLSVLFDELQSHLVKKFDFQPSGSETIEKVNNNLTSLRKGKWLPSTEVNTAFYFRARASIGSGFLKQQYTLEVGDYAGEHIDEFDSSSDMWLHKSDYFKYALSSDALMFCVDGDILFSNDIEKIEDSQSMLIGAYQMLLTESQGKAGEKFKTPIALLLLKSDLFSSDEEAFEQLKNKYSRLLSLLTQKSKHFNFFPVSSVGITQDGMPPKEIKPKNVCDPMFWLLTKSNY